MKKLRTKSRTELRHKLLWYVETYGLCLSTLRRHRRLLDHPRELLVQLLSSRGPTPDVNKLSDFVNDVG